MFIGSQTVAVESPPQPEVTSIPLSDYESFELLDVQSICSVAFLNGNPQGAAAHIRDRYKAVAEANPWLLGRLVRNRNHRTLQLVYPAGPISEEMIDQAFWNDPPGLNINPNMPYTRIAAALATSEACLPSGKAHINTDKLVTRISVSSDATNVMAFCVIMSMSHIVADGYTYAKIMGMISGAGKIAALIPTRNVEQDAIMRERVHDSVNCVSILRSWCVSLCCAKPVNVSVRRVDHSKIASIRARARTRGTRPVTPNAIIISELGRALNSSVVLVPCGQRGLWDHITPHHAGNYQIDRFIDKYSYAVPESVQHALQTRPDCGRKASLLLDFASRNACVYTDLSGFTPLFSIPYCEHVIQFYVFYEVPGLDICQFFKCDSEGTCLMLISSQHDDRWFSENMPVCDRVSRSIFG